MESITRSKPRLSIGMPVYNGERFLRQAIESILTQTFTDFELIISDNASTDATAEICRGYAARDARVRYVAQPVNRGAAWNFNHLIALAQAKYYKLADADDMHAPRYLECCMSEHDRASSSVVLVCSRGVVIDGHDRLIGPCHDRMDLRQPRPSDRLRLAIRNVGYCNVLFGVIRTDVLRACRPLGGHPGADHVLINELALRGQFWEVPDPLFHRRVHAGSSFRPGWTLIDTAAYLDPQNKSIFVLPCSRVFLNTIRVIRAANLPWSEALRCHEALLCEWLLPSLHFIKAELRFSARMLVNRFRSKDAIASSARRARRWARGPSAHGSKSHSNG